MREWPPMIPDRVIMTQVLYFRRTYPQLNPVSPCHSASVGNIKEAIVNVLTKATKPLKKEEIARLVGKHTGKDVNKYLYELKDEKKATKVQNQPPLWTSSDACFQEVPGTPASRSGGSQTSPPKLVTDGYTPAFSNPGGPQTRDARHLVIEEHTRISTLPYPFLEATRLLTLGEISDRDWERFAGKVGFSVEDIALARNKSNPVKAVIVDWQTKREATFGNFVKIMTDMNRVDVLCSLKEGLQEQLGSSARKMLEAGIAMKDSSN